MRSKTATAVAVLTLGALFAGCGEDADTQATRDTVEESAQDARQAAENAFAALRTDAERLVDEIQTRKAPEAKEALLDRCRNALERMRKAESESADEVDRLCNRIRETDIDVPAWAEIKAEIERLTMS